jgi:Tol biopolymer transport system component
MNRVAASALLLLALAPASLAAQYFGQNRMQYSAFKFKIIETQHFDVFYYDQARPVAMDAARMAERSYIRLSNVLGHEFREKKPIILYASHSDFQQTNALGEQPSEATGGVTDFYRHRMVLPLTGSYEELEHVMQHEMTHQFQYDIWSNGTPGAGLQFLINLNPPLWFVEGMAEYLSIGPVDPNTAMWLRDAALEGTLPSINQLEHDPRVFPYRFGHAILAYIGERWGDESIGTIMRSTMAGGGGLDGAFRRSIGISLAQLSDEWRDYVNKKYLPEIANRQKASSFSTQLLTEKTAEGDYHLAPGMAPDGSQIVYFSERNWISFDLYLADATTGKVKKRLLKSTYSGAFETFRFINSSATWSPDGTKIVLAAKQGPRDRIVLVNVARNKVVQQIKPMLGAITSPAFSPDGSQIVFSGDFGGVSDLYIVNADGTGLRQLTNDKYADLEPTWSPDGQTIAFTTDRGPGTDFSTLRFGNMRVALYHLADGTTEVLPQMQMGKNVNPQWAPDGQSIAFVSDRNGVSNLYLYKFNDRQVYQLTNLYTGIQGITSTAPVISWAPTADRLAFVYYEAGDFDIYAVNNPRGLAREPWQPPAYRIARDGTPIEPSPAEAPAPIRPAPTTVALAPDLAAPPAVPDTTVAPEPSASSLYRTSEGFRAADAPATAADSAVPPPVSISALMDTATPGLPDTLDFLFRPYKVHYSIDFLARPTIGYTRQSFGGGFYGGSTVVLGDMLGDHNLVFSGYINGQVGESMILAEYVNRVRRLNWATSIGQTPYYNLLPSQIIYDSPAPGTQTYVENVRRLIFRDAQIQGIYPLSRFQRLEGSMRLANVDDAIQQTSYVYDPITGAALANPVRRVIGLENVFFIAPTLALVYDNTIDGYVGPAYGTRYRLGVTPTVGGWNFTTLNADYRRYILLKRPLTLAFRAQYFGQIGQDASLFQVFIGNTAIVRGNTPGSYQRDECSYARNYTAGICVPLNDLIGTQMGITSVELRFPILTPSMSFLPAAFPPIEGAFFWDMGIAANDYNVIKWKRAPGDDPFIVRVPIQSFGVSARMNLFGFMILRLDYAIPQERTGMNGLWTLSIGPVW